MSRSEHIEADLDRLINRQAEKNGAEREREELYMESVRRHHAQRQEALCWEWLRFHQSQLNNQRTTFALLERHHRQEIAKYERMLNIDHEGGDAA